VVQRHSHPQEQVTIVLEGLLVEVGGRGFTAAAGDMVHVPPGVEHSVAAITDAVVVVDVFSPPRDDWGRRA
jgi:quercetin dioxygenase-like cupin family protein